MEAETAAAAVDAVAAADIAAAAEVSMLIIWTAIRQLRNTKIKLEKERKMGNSSGSMLYMVVLLIIIYVVGMGIYQGVKFIQKKREEAKDKKFREEE